jgi:hypothetical protein
MTLFDTESKDIILISYPSGGFGNFLYHVLTEHADNTVKVANNQLEISNNGNSHSTKKYTNVYYHDPVDYLPSIDNVDIKDKKILVLCDNGILDDSYVKLNKVFPNATIVRTTITSLIRPIIYQTCVTKAMNTNVLAETKAHVDNNWIDAHKEYAIRENFTLLYHNWPFKGWNDHNQCVNVNLELLINDTYNTIKNLIYTLDMQIINDSKLKQVIDEWQQKNSKYFKIYYECKKIKNALETNADLSIEHITSLHDQGYINYWLEKTYNITIPVYDYKNWFKNTNEIHQVINEIKYTDN